MYFQNPFGEEFNQSWPIDQQATFSIGANLNNIAETIAFYPEPYDFSVNNIFTINFAFDPSRKGYTAINVNVAGAIPAATTAVEVMNLLNADVLFADNFTAYIKSPTGPISAGPPYKVFIRSKRPKSAVRFYISNTSAEIQLRFNKTAKVKDLPTYFDRHTIDNRFVYPDGAAMLIALNPLNPLDAAIIAEAGLPPMPQTDWELLHGRSNTHTFSKVTIDGSSRITEIIEYFSGAIVGDMARKIQYTYTGVNTIPDQITTIPYTLQPGDLVIPPP